MSHPVRNDRRGITLLEVLISLGILSVGLASVVALIPAGGDQAKKAIIDDRRGTLGLNALADCVNRGLLDPAKWAPAQAAASSYRLIFDPAPSVALPGCGLTSVSTTGFTAAPVADEIFRGQDDLVYRLPDEEDAPAIPMFFGGVVKRMTEGHLTWLATLVPATSSSPLHRLTVVTMHRRGDAFLTTASSMSGPYVQLPSPSSLAKEDVPRFFSPGAVVLLTDNANVHEWRKVVMAAPDVSASGALSQIELTLDRDAPATFSNILAVEGANGMYERVVRLEEMSPWSR